MKNFCDMILACNLLDAGFQGSPFTWKHGRLFQRLDRVLVNIQWRLKFQGANVFHLPFFKSDHRALLVQLKGRKKPNRHRRPFRFLAAWLTHEDFPNMMASSWQRNGQWCNQIKYLQNSPYYWNRRVFGNIFERKQKLIRELERLDDKLVACSSAELEECHKNLWGELERVLSQEEILWYQKFRSKWLHSGDRNTKYFHGITAVRRKRNSYDILQDDGANWVGDPVRLEALVTNYYRNLFANDTDREPACISGAFPKLSSEDLISLEREITCGDIYNVVRHMGSFKAPGPDGFQAAFFKSQ